MPFIPVQEDGGKPAPKPAGDPYKQQIKQAVAGPPAPTGGSNFTESIPVQTPFELNNVNLAEAEATKIAQAQKAQDRLTRQVEKQRLQLVGNIQQVRDTVDSLGLTPAQAGARDYLDNAKAQKTKITNFLDAITTGQHSSDSNLFDRARGIPPQVINTHPNTMSQLLFSGASTEDINNVGWTLHNGRIYFDQVNNFAGIPGALTLANVRANKIADPRVRAYAQQFLGRITTEPATGLQQIIFNALSGGQSLQALESTPYASIDPRVGPIEIQTSGNEISRFFDPGTTDLKVAATAILSIFPNADVQTLLAGHVASSGEEFLGWLKTAPGRILQGQQAASALSPQLSQGYNPIQQGKPISSLSMEELAGGTALGASDLLTGGMNLGGILGGKSLRGTAGLLPGGKGFVESISPALHYSGKWLMAAGQVTERSVTSAIVTAASGYDAFYGIDTTNGKDFASQYGVDFALTQSNPNDPLTQYIINAQGWKPGEHQGYVDSLNIIIPWVGTAVLAEGVGAFRDITRVPVDVNAPFEWRSPLKSYINSVGGLTPEEFVWTKAYAQNEVAWRAAIEDPRLEGDINSIAGQIQKSTKGMKLDMAKSLAATSAEDAWARQSIFSHYQDNILTPKVQRGLSAEYRQNNQDIADLTKLQQDTLAEAERITQIPQARDTVSEIEGHNAEVIPLHGGGTDPIAFEQHLQNSGVLEIETKLEELRARQLEINAKQSDYMNATPMDVFPRASLYKRFISNNPTNSFELMIGDFYRRTGLRLEKFSEHMPSSIKFIPVGHANWLNINADYITKLLRVAKTPEATIANVIGQLTDLKVGANVFEWTQKAIVPALEEGITKGGARYVHPDLLARAIQVFDNPIESRMSTMYHELSPPDISGNQTWVRHNVLEKYGDNPGDRTPMVSQSSEFLGVDTSFSLPSVESIKSASNAVRRWQFNWSKKGGGNIWQRSVSTPYEFVKQTLGFATRVLKPIVLLPRFVALAGRIQIDEMATNVATGRRAIIWPQGFENFVPGLAAPLIDSPLGQYLWGPEGVFPHDFSPSVGAARLKGLSAAEQGLNPLGGMMTSPDITTNQWIRSRTYKDLQDYRSNPGLFATAQDAPTILNGIHEQFGLDLASPITRYLAVNGVEETLRWLETNEFQKAFLLDHMANKFETAQTDVAGYLKNLDAHLNELAGKDPLLRRALGTGKVLDTTAAGLARKTGATDPAFQAAYKNATSKLLATEEGIRQGLQDGLAPHLLDALYQEKTLAQEALQTLDSTAKKTDFISLSDRAAIKGYLRQGISDGTYELPPGIMVDTSYNWHEAKDMSKLDHVNGMVDAYNNMLYRGLSHLNAVDKVGARGSLWIQAYDDSFKRYVAAGWDVARADELAMVKAAATTRDLLYNLSEPTQFHRDVRNVFWFAPAWQRIMSTWLVKIPSEYYWPVGISYLANKGSLIKQAFVDTGLVTTVTGPDGKPVEQLNMGWVKDIFDKLGVPSPDFYSKPEGFSLALTGLPGLATVPDFLLGKASEHIGGVFTALSHALQPYGPDNIPGSQTLYYGYEAIFGTKPPWSGLAGQYGQDVYDRSMDQSRQYAFEAMTKAGDVPPNIADYSHEKSAITGNLVPSTADGLKFQADTADYWARLDAKSKEMERGIAFGRFLGATFIPMSLYPTTDEKQAWTDFFQKQVIPAGFDPTGGYTQYQHDLIQHYLGDNPGSVGYATSFIVSGSGAKNLPYSQNVSSEDYYNKLRNGELDLLSPDQYALRFQAIQSQQHFRATLNAAYNEAGTTWQKQLLSGYDINQKVAAAQEQWDTYVGLNAKAGAYLRDGYLTWASKYGIDVQGTQSEQASLLHRLLKEAGPFFIGAGGLPNPDYKSTLGQLSSYIAQHSNYPAPTTKLGIAKDYWYKNVLTPYYEQVSPLYQKAQDASIAGVPGLATKYYDQVKAITNSYGKFVDTPYGRGPTPEQYTFGQMSPASQANAITAWATRPPGWLTDFQLAKAGMPKNADAMAMYNAFDDANTKFYAWVDNNHISSSSTVYDNMVQSRDTWLANKAKSIGPKAVVALELSQGAPIVRLGFQNYAIQDPNFQQLYPIVAQLTQNIINHGTSPRGYGQDVALPGKIALERQIEFYRAKKINGLPNPSYNQAFDDEWAALGRSIPLPGKSTREGVLLYEAILFGQFNPLAYGLRDLELAVYAPYPNH